LSCRSRAGCRRQAAFTPERPATPGSRIFANARVVTIDTKARTITVRGGGVGKDETFPVEAQALPRAGELKPGDLVVLTLRAGGTGPEVATQIERSVAGARPPLDPNFDPRQNPLRDPRVIPGLSEPAPTPTPSPTPTPPPLD
jgi:hypothetical protein